MTSVLLPAKTPGHPGFVTAPLTWLLRLEAFAVFAAALVAFRADGGAWWFFALLFLAPDLAMAFYAFGRGMGATAYNAAHAAIGPILLGLGGFGLGSQVCGLAALVWLAHIGFDRALGYGLKYPTGFGDTHLGRIGRR